MGCFRYLIFLPGSALEAQAISFREMNGNATEQDTHKSGNNVDRSIVNSSNTTTESGEKEFWNKNATHFLEKETGSANGKTGRELVMTRRCPMTCTAQCFMELVMQGSCDVSGCECDVACEKECKKAAQRSKVHQASERDMPYRKGPKPTTRIHAAASDTFAESPAAPVQHAGPASRARSPSPEDKTRRVASELRVTPEDTPCVQSEYYKKCLETCGSHDECHLRCQAGCESKRRRKFLSYIQQIIEQSRKLSIVELKVKADQQDVKNELSRVENDKATNGLSNHTESDNDELRNKAEERIRFRTSLIFKLQKDNKQAWKKTASRDEPDPPWPTSVTATIDQVLGVELERKLERVKCFGDEQGGFGPVAKFKRTPNTGGAEEELVIKYDNQEMPGVKGPYENEAIMLYLARKLNSPYILKAPEFGPAAVVSREKTVVSREKTPAATEVAPLTMIVAEFMPGGDLTAALEYFSPSRSGAFKDVYEQFVREMCWQLLLGIAFLHNSPRIQLPAVVEQRKATELVFTHHDIKAENVFLRVPVRGNKFPPFEEIRTNVDYNYRSSPVRGRKELDDGRFLDVSGSRKDLVLGDLGTLTQTQGGFLGEADWRHGTPPYMPPEKFDAAADVAKRRRLNQRLIGEKVDMFAVGVVLYELMGAPHGVQLPSNGGTLARLKDWRRSSLIQMSKVINDVFCKKYSGNAVDFLERALAADPEKRLSIDEALKHPWFRDGLGPRRACA